MSKTASKICFLLFPVMVLNFCFILLFASFLATSFGSSLVYLGLLLPLLLLSSLHRDCLAQLISFTYSLLNCPSLCINLCVLPLSVNLLFVYCVPSLKWSLILFCPFWICLPAVDQFCLWTTCYLLNK